LNKNQVTPMPQAPIIMHRRIGNTIYQLKVHLSPTAKETAEKKIARLIRNEVINV